MDVHDTDRSTPRPSGGLSRRKFLGSAGSAAALTTVLGASTATAAGATTRLTASPKSASPQLSVPGAGLVGATVTAQGTNSRKQQAQIFDQFVGRPIAETIQKIYYQPGQFPTSDSAVAGLSALGCEVILCYKPQPGGADRTALGQSLTALQQAYGNVHAVILWQEVQNQQNNTTANQYKTMVQQDYGPLIRQGHNLKLYYDATAAQGEQGIIDYFPGGNYIDVTAMDLYADRYYSGGITLDTIQSLADNPPDGSPSTPLGILEFGTTISGTLPPDPVDIHVLAFFDYLLSTMSARLANGKFNGPVCYYDGGGPDDITASNDFRVTTLQAMFDTLCKNSTVQG